MMNKRSDFIYQQPVAFHCQNKEQAKSIKSSIERYGALPADLSMKVLGALSKHKNTLRKVAESTKNNKMGLIVHLQDIMAFIKDITG